MPREIKVKYTLKAKVWSLVQMVGLRGLCVSQFYGLYTVNVKYASEYSIPVLAEMKSTTR